MSEATIENEKDLSQSPYKIQIRVPFTSDFIKNHFKCSRSSRNIEEIWEKCKKGEVERTSTINLRLGEDCYSNEKYKQALVRQLASEPTSQKEQFPNWVKFLAGEKARISGNSIYVITTSMNFTKMESFVKCILEMLTFPATIFGYSANFQVDTDSIRLKIFRITTRIPTRLTYLSVTATGIRSTSSLTTLSLRRNLFHQTGLSKNMPRRSMLQDPRILHRLSPTC